MSNTFDRLLRDRLRDRRFARSFRAAQRRIRRQQWWMLAKERAKLAKEEARYECQRCGKALTPDYGLSESLNRLRAFLWRQAHRLNCPA